MALTAAALVGCLAERSTADLDQRTTVDRQGDAGDEIGLIPSQEKRRVGNVPAGAHFAAQRHPGVALRGDLGADADCWPAPWCRQPSACPSAPAGCSWRGCRRARCATSCSVRTIIAAFVAL